MTARAVATWNGGAVRSNMGRPSEPNSVGRSELSRRQTLRDCGGNVTNRRNRLKLRMNLKLLSPYGRSEVAADLITSSVGGAGLADRRM